MLKAGILTWCGKKIEKVRHFCSKGAAKCSQSAAKKAHGAANLCKFSHLHIVLLHLRLEFACLTCLKWVHWTAEGIVLIGDCSKIKFY